MRYPATSFVLLGLVIFGILFAILLQTAGFIFPTETAEPRVTESPDFYRHYGMVNPNGFAEQDVAHVIPYEPESTE